MLKVTILAIFLASTPAFSQVVFGNDDTARVSEGSIDTDSKKEVEVDAKFFNNNCNNCYCNDYNCQINCQKCQNQLGGGQFGGQFGSQNCATCSCANSICANQCYKCLNVGGGNFGNFGGGFGNNCLYKRSISKRSPQDVSGTGQVGGSSVETNTRFIQCIQSNCNNCYCNDYNCQRYCQKCQIGGGIGNCLFKRSVSKRSPQEISTGGSSSNAADTKFSLANCFNNGGGFGNNQYNQFGCLTCSCNNNICANQCTKCFNNGGFGGINGGFGGNNQGNNCYTCNCQFSQCYQQCTKCTSGFGGGNFRVRDNGSNGDDNNNAGVSSGNAGVGTGTA